MESHKQISDDLSVQLVTFLILLYEAYVSIHASLTVVDDKLEQLCLNLMLVYLELRMVMAIVRFRRVESKKNLLVDRMDPKETSLISDMVEFPVFSKMIVNFDLVLLDLTAHR